MALRGEAGAAQRRPAHEVALALTGFAMPAGVSPRAQADAARDPSASAFLAGALKPQMQKTLARASPGIVVTKVTCFVPTTSKADHRQCTVKFTVAKSGSSAPTS